MEEITPAPIIDGFEIFEVVVDENDPCWGIIDSKRYSYCSNEIRTGDFFVKPGKHRIKYVLLPFEEYDPTNRQVFEEITRRNLTRPDGPAGIEKILDAHKGTYVMGITRAKISDYNGAWQALYIYQENGARFLLKFPADKAFYLSKECKFVAVVSEEPIL